jgi:hypothetical protein
MIELADNSSDDPKSIADFKYLHIILHVPGRHSHQPFSPVRASESAKNISNIEAMTPPWNFPHSPSGFDILGVLVSLA